MSTPQLLPGVSHSGVGPSPSVRPLPAAPTSADVVRLAYLWTNAIRVAFRRGHYRGPDLSNATRQAQFTRLASRLREWGASAEEFTTAIAEHHAKYNHSKTPRIPNAQQVSGDWGRTIWLDWRAKRIAEGAGSTRRLDAAAEQGTEDEAAVLGRLYAATLAEIQAEGADYAITLDLPAEILWMLFMTEPIAREAIQLRVRQTDSPTLRDRLKVGLAALAKKPPRQLWLLRIRNRVSGTIRPVLHSGA